MRKGPKAAQLPINGYMKARWFGGLTMFKGGDPMDAKALEMDWRKKPIVGKEFDA